MVKKFKEWLEKYWSKRWYSWQTMIWLSVVSGILAAIANVVGGNLGLVSMLVAACGWFFFIVGMSWFAKERCSPFAPWITAAVICTFVFGNWELGDWSLALIIWPIVSAVVFALPYFWNDSLEKKLPDPSGRVVILLMFGTQLLLSFWIQFYLVLSNYIEEYPSLYSDDLSESLFIVRTPNRRPQDPRGVLILDLLDLEMQVYYGDRLWEEVNQELTDTTIVRPIIDDLLINVQTPIVSLKEDNYWKLGKIFAEAKGEQAQKLTLRYNWTGSKAQEDKDYYVEKICTLQPKASRNPLAPDALMTNVDCDSTTVCGWLPKPGVEPKCDN